MVLRETVFSAVATSPSRKDVLSLLLSEPVSALRDEPDELPPIAADELLSIEKVAEDEGVSSRSRSVSTVTRLSSGLSMTRSIFSLSSVMSERVLEFVSAAATCATVMPFSMAALRSTVMCSASAALSSPSSTSPTPSTPPIAAASCFAADCMASMSSL